MFNTKIKLFCEVSSLSVVSIAASLIVHYKRHVITLNLIDWLKHSEKDS